MLVGFSGFGAGLSISKAEIKLYIAIFPNTGFDSRAFASFRCSASCWDTDIFNTSFVGITTLYTTIMWMSTRNGNFNVFTPTWFCAIMCYEEEIFVRNRIKKIRKDADMTQTEFGKEIRATRDIVATYENGRVIPDKSMLELICIKFNVNPEWLETGEGKPYKEGVIPELVKALRNAPALLAALERILPRMDADDWKALNAVVEKAIKEEE